MPVGSSWATLGALSCGCFADVAEMRPQNEALRMAIAKTRNELWSFSYAAMAARAGPSKRSRSPAATSANELPERCLLRQSSPS